ncbi:MAG: membrane protein insertase YidC [Acidobacteriota bacterium]
MDNQRLFLAFFLSLMVFVGWSMLFPPEPAVQRSADRAAESTAESGADGGSVTTPPDAERLRDGQDGSGTAVEAVEAVGEGSTEAAETGAADAAAGDAAAPNADTPNEVTRAEHVPIAAEEERAVVIETETMRAELTNRGGQLLSYILKTHVDSDGEPLDLVRQRGSDLYPFSILVDGRSAALNGALFATEEATTEDGRPVVSFRYAGPEGAATKRFVWSPDGRVEVETTVEDVVGWSMLFGPGITDSSSGKGYGQSVGHAVGYRRAGEDKLLEAKDTDDEVILTATGLDWISLEDNFFLLALLPREGIAEARVRPVFERESAEPGRPRFLPLDTASDTDDLRREQLVLLRAAQDTMRFDALFSPKQYRTLAAMEGGLERTVRWGMMTVVAKPLYHLLAWIHDHVVPNWGWAIIVVTLLVKLAFFPLTHKSQKSMSRMQELNPRVQAIRQKYRSKLRDKQGRPNVEAQQQMNQEVMAVYREAGVNPASGCLPILLQMPVFFALFRLLGSTVELRGADWMLWVRDLSIPDPWLILPILVAVSGLAIQRVMPQSPDPRQRKILQFMPVGFAFFAVYMPAGLVLYMLTNNLFTMLQQVVINRLGGRSPAAAPAS